MPDAGASRLGRLIVVPAMITLAATFRRLIGEFLHWSPTLFNPAAGNGGALVGISWLVPVFGIYFAIELARVGRGPERVALGFGPRDRAAPGSGTGRHRVPRWRSGSGSACCRSSRSGSPARS